MFDDFTLFLWLLKLGALVNIHFLANTYVPSSITADARILVPARILFAVSAYRCLFPVQYTRNVVFHSSSFSSIFLTRLLATFSEVAYVYLFSHVIRLLNVHHVGWVNLLSWVMVLALRVVAPAGSALVGGLLGAMVGGCASDCGDFFHPSAVVVGAGAGFLVGLLGASIVD